MVVRPTFFLLVVVLIVSCIGQKIRDPILQCDFDDGLCDGWENEEDELYRWVVKKGPAKEAGPKYDFTRSNEEGGYLFFNDRRPKYGKAIIRTPRMDLTKHEKYCLRFRYFMAGTLPGEMRMYHSNLWDGRPVSLVFRAGPRSKNDTDWIFEDVTVSRFFSDQPFDDVYFRIQALKGRTETNVVAIDDFTVSPGSCPKLVPSKTATTATFGPQAVTPAGGGGNLANEEVQKRNEKMIRENEERNRKIQEMNELRNTGTYSTMVDPDQPTQPAQPIQPTQPQQTTTSGLSEAERQQQIQEEQRRLQEEAEARRNAERERIEKEEKERKELIEKRKKEQEEKQRQQREEEEKRNKELREKQKQERLRKQKEEEEKRKVMAAKKREEDERKAKEKADRDRKEREEQERKQREEDERRRKEEEEGKRTQSQKNGKRRRNGKGKNAGGRKRGGNDDKAGDPNYEKCGTGYAHKTRQMCCNGKARKKFGSGACCGDASYHPDKKGCCGRVTYDPRGTDQCCGIELYNGVTHACCGDIAFELSTNACIDGVVQPIVT